MCNELLIRRLAGIFVMISLALGWLVHPAFYLFTAFIGLNLFQSSLTGFCPLERVLGHWRLMGCRPHTGG